MIIVGVVDPASVQASLAGGDFDDFELCVGDWVPSPTGL
jgi:hypothetical protein